MILFLRKEKSLFVKSLNKNAYKRKEKFEESKRLHRWCDMGADRNPQRLQPMRDAMTPEKPPINQSINRFLGGIKNG